MAALSRRSFARESTSDSVLDIVVRNLAVKSASAHAVLRRQNHPVRATGFRNEIAADRDRIGRVGAPSAEADRADCGKPSPEADHAERSQMQHRASPLFGMTASQNTRIMGWFNSVRNGSYD